MGPPPVHISMACCLAHSSCTLTLAHSSCTLRLPPLFPIGFEPPPVGRSGRERLMGAPPVHISMACRLAHSLLHTRLAHSPCHPFPNGSEPPPVGCSGRERPMGAAPVHMAITYGLAHSLLHTHSCTLTLPLLFPIGFEPPPVGCTVRERLMGPPPIYISMACCLAHSSCTLTLAHSPCHPCSLMGLSHHPWVWWDRAANGSRSCPHGHRLWPCTLALAHSLLHTQPPTPLPRWV